LASAKIVARIEIYFRSASLRIHAYGAYGANDDHRN
jgi:hypothetical protein